MKFDQLKDNFSWVELELGILKFWEEQKIFEKSIAKGQESKNDPFIFFEGPPTANGKPGIHHIGGRTIKDLICRYKTMKGFQVNRKAGWDTHGLPVEVEVEKKLNLKNKQDVFKYGVAEFNQKCRESVFTYKNQWDDITRRIGYWLDLDDAYITLENDYIESVWHILANFFDRDLIYKGHKTVPFCPRCETTLSSHEVSQAYEDVSDPSVYVRMKSADGDFAYLVWTTTPWTLPSNAAICFHPDIAYVRVKYQDEQLVLAEALAENLLGENYEVIETKKGSEFIGQKYQPLFDTFADEKENAFFAINADFVTTEDGTGIVHIAPGFGADDYQEGKKHNLPVLQAIHPNGHFKENTGWLAGKYIKEADPDIVTDLDKRGLLFKSEVYKHSYPFCWRCHSPLIYIARQSWYIKTTQFKEKLLEYNQQINWYPPEIGAGRFGEWLENNIDWAISRERFWGTPLPIWICEECDHKRAVGSVKQLYEEGIDVPENIDLHKPHIDNIELTCDKCSGKMKRVPEVIDVWFDSGAMPFAQWHYPFENKELFEQRFPADFISEAVDQTRGWFYSLLAISTIYFDQPCFKNCIVQEFVVDRDGRKMSKHVGNVIDPFEMTDKFGADAVRWYMLHTSHPWISLKFDPEGISIAQRKFFDTMKNCYAFWALYANIDNIADRAEKAGQSVGQFLQSTTAEPKLIDLWVISRYNSVVTAVGDALENYNLTHAIREINDFVIEDLSNWYIRLNRSRFYGSGDDPDKMLVYRLLHQILTGVCGLMAPVAPFFSDFVYRQLLGANSTGEPISIHLTDFPTSDSSVIDSQLEDEMGVVQKIVSLALAGRKRKNLKVRQPLAGIMVHNSNGQKLSEKVNALILTELNIKKLTFLDDSTDLISFSAKPNFAKLGPKFGKQIGAAANIIKSLSSDDLGEFVKNDKISIDLDGQSFELVGDELEIVKGEKEGFAVEIDGPITIALDITLNPDLIDEGFARELVNKIQARRRSSGFEVTDRVNIKLFADEPLSVAAERFKDYIQKETLADSYQLFQLSELPQANDGKENSEDDNEQLSINGEQAYIVVRK